MFCSFIFCFKAICYTGVSTHPFIAFVTERFFFGKIHGKKSLNKFWANDAWCFKHNITDTVLNLVFVLIFLVSAQPWRRCAWLKLPAIANLKNLLLPNRFCYLPLAPLPKRWTRTRALCHLQSSATSGTSAWTSAQWASFFRRFLPPFCRISKLMFSQLVFPMRVSIWKQ